MRAKVRILIALFMVLAVTASYSVNLQGMMIYATEDTETIELQNDAETDSAKSEEVDGSDAKSEERTDATPQDSAEENASAEDGEDSDADAADAESEEAIGSDVSDEAVAGTLVNTDTSYRVTVTFSEEAGIPEGAELIVAEKPEAEYIDRAEKELNAEEVAFAVFLDISIVKDGKEIPVSDDVKVEVTMGDMPSDAEGEMSVVHFADDSGAAEAVTCSTVENTVQFEAESFSVYGFLLKANAVVDSGYGNVEHTVGWELTEENGRNILTFKLLDGASTDKEKAITRLLDSAGKDVTADFRKSINEVRIEEGIKGIGWTALYKRNTDCYPIYSSDYPVNQKETGVFQEFENLDTVKTCSTIERIGWSAFRKCYNLSSFDFVSMKNLKEIMDQAFSPSGLTTVDMSACTSLETIYHGAFSGVSFTDKQKLTSVTFPASLKTIGSQAFYHCPSLKYVTFQDISKVTTVYDKAFQGVNRGNLNPIEYIADEKTKQKAVLRYPARDLFTGVSEMPKEVFWYTGLVEEIDAQHHNYWPLTIAVKEKTTTYNGSEQYGYEVENVTGSGDDTCTVTGLKDGHVLSAPDYLPSSGTDAGEYDNGSFQNAGTTFQYAGMSCYFNFAYRLAREMPSSRAAAFLPFRSFP